ncbi:RING-H2 finger protein ATL18-like [Rhodamnia argentea]|uniref:RING-H2 finger protein ATL18-like n=1 Tax=Rhodamnia argentea TaxID=178133 RepID=A0A8B8PZ95_9MYRT|nr:RING-H2 finger protein ATL18-like [Rhodamnia argentea]
MYCLVYAQSGVSTALLIFYTCMWLPLMQLRRAISRVRAFISCKYEPQESSCSFQLPVGRFQDLQKPFGEEEEEGDHEKTCSICLVDYEGEDLVSKLHRCGHVFHLDCIERWLERSQFTCPLCRKLVFDVRSSAAKQRW